MRLGGPNIDGSAFSCFTPSQRLLQKLQNHLSHGVVNHVSWCGILHKCARIAQVQTQTICPQNHLLINCLVRLYLTILLPTNTKKKSGAIPGGEHPHNYHVQWANAWHSGFWQSTCRQGINSRSPHLPILLVSHIPYDVATIYTYTCTSTPTHPQVHTCTHRHTHPLKHTDIPSHPPDQAFVWETPHPYCWRMWCPVLVR